MATAAPSPYPAHSVQAPTVRRTPAAAWWATLGAGFLAFEIYVIAKWVTGPYFKHVSAGPNDPPGWMKVALVCGMILSFVAAVLAVWHFIYKPWHAERRLTTDGIFVLVCFLFVWQDPLSSYFAHTYTYNAWLPNMGSWVQGIPGWMAPAKPGAMVPEPILFTPFVYVWLFVGTSLVGASVMRRTRARWPQVGDMRLILVCFVCMFFASVVAEGLVMMPLGFYTYIGGHWAIFPQAYNKFPVHEAVFAGAWFTGMACLRYYLNDRGQTVAERGVEQLRGGPRRQNLYRFLAVFGIANLIVLCCYNLPTAIIGAHATNWPADLQKRSYLNDGVCGSGTDRACPGPAIPNARGNDSGYVTPDGRLVFPKGGAQRQPQVPLSSEDSRPFSGPVF